jgi:hypothetical protein
LLLHVIYNFLNVFLPSFKIVGYSFDLFNVSLFGSRLSL